jgi:hypothetical protein
MHEGSRVVGHGVVLETIPPADGAELAT